ncbi:NAD(P)H-dependent oxidoreductase subunit E [bacterium]|nr:MAG: NAD(P)H-dependent oxidoreductase subunit E [bacterium]
MTSSDFETLKTELEPQIDAILAQYPQERSALLPLVHLFQERLGFVTPEAVEYISEVCDVTRAQCQSTISFYTLFYRRPIGKYNLQVCRNLSCSLRGARQIMERFRERLGIDHLETTADGLFTYEEVECLAACDRAPCMQVNLNFVYDMTPEMVDEILDSIIAGTYPVAPLAQSEQPERKVRGPEWSRASRKSAGAVGVPNANNGGGIDQTGRTIAERFRKFGIMPISSPGRMADPELVEGMVPAPHDDTVMEHNY